MIDKSNPPKNSTWETFLSEIDLENKSSEKPIIGVPDEKAANDWVNMGASPEQIRIIKQGKQ